MSEAIKRAKELSVKLGGICCNQDLDVSLFDDIRAIITNLIANAERIEKLYIDFVEAERKSWHAICAALDLDESADSTATIVEKIGQLKKELQLTDGLLKNSDRVLNAIPECPVHGPCVPHALDWIERKKTTQRFRAIGATAKGSDESLDVIEFNECFADSLTAKRFRTVFAEIRRLTYHIRRVCPCGLCNGKGHTEDRNCVRCGGKGWNENAPPIVPLKWRPLSVLTFEVAWRWNKWAFRFPDNNLPQNRNILPAVVYRSQFPDDWSWPEALAKAVTGKDAVMSDEITCRPIDLEGVPVSWSEVGL